MGKNAKIVPFFYKELERTQRLFRSCIKNGKERKKNVPFFYNKWEKTQERCILLKRTGAQPWLQHTLDPMKLRSIGPCSYKHQSCRARDKSSDNLTLNDLFRIRLRILEYRIWIWTRFPIQILWSGFGPDTRSYICYLSILWNYYKKTPYNQS